MNQKHHCAAIIPAAGIGRRMGTKTKKQFLKLAGREIVAYTIEKFENCKEVDEIILVTAEDTINLLYDIVRKEKFQKVTAIVKGGKERQDSVYAGLCVVNKKTTIVSVHDGVRPFVSVEDIAKTIQTAKEKKACALGVKTKDTIKICNEQNQIVDTPKRDFVWCIQTPQTFEKKMLLEAFEKAYETGFIGTDESVLVERTGNTVFVAEGHYENIKITTPEDIVIGEAFLQKEGEKYRENSGNLYRWCLFR